MQKTPLSRQEKKDQTRDGLVATASQLFAKKGILATTTAEVAKAHKVSHGTVFVHFPTRDDLIIAVIEDFGARLSVEFGDCIKQTDLRRLLRFHLEVLAEYENFYYRLISEVVLLPPKVKSLLFMLNAAISWGLYRAAQPGMKAGELKTLSRAQLFNTWIALVQYQVLNRELLSDSLPILKTNKNELVDHFIGLVQIEKGDSR